MHGELGAYDATDGGSRTRSCPSQTCNECSEPAPVDVPRFVMWRCAQHEEEERARQQHAKDEEQRRIRDYALNLIGVPLGYRGSTFETLKSNAIVEVCKTWLASRGVSRGRFLGLLGPTGVGKTAAAAAISNQLVESIRSDQRFTLAGALYRRLHNFNSVNGAMEEATSTRLLVLDDFQPPRPEVASLIEELFIAREADGRATIVTSNLMKKQLLAVLGDRVADRLKAWGEIHEFPGRSLRGEV
jgi:DNA replication protein DnaC